MGLVFCCDGTVRARLAHPMVVSRGAGDASDGRGSPPEGAILHFKQIPFYFLPLYFLFFSFFTNYHYANGSSAGFSALPRI
eukprot:7231470-Prymnesium_polylepis.2